jgi:soluble P-type ATPase
MGGIATILNLLQSDLHTGIMEISIPWRRERYGKNVWTAKRVKSLWKYLWMEGVGVDTVVVGVCAICGVGVDGENWWTSIIILIFTIIVMLYCAYTQQQSDEKTLKLSRLLESKRHTVVLREGKRMTIPWPEVCIGDIIPIASPQPVHADGILLTQSQTPHAVTIHPPNSPHPSLYSTFSPTLPSTPFVINSGSTVMTDCLLLVTGVGRGEEVRVRRGEGRDWWGWGYAGMGVVWMGILGWIQGLVMAGLGGGMIMMMERLGRILRNYREKGMTANVIKTLSTHNILIRDLDCLPILSTLTTLLIRYESILTKGTLTITHSHPLHPSFPLYLHYLTLPPTPQTPITKMLQSHLSTLPSTLDTQGIEHMHTMEYNQYRQRQSNIIVDREGRVGIVSVGKALFPMEGIGEEQATRMLAAGTMVWQVAYSPIPSMDSIVEATMDDMGIWSIEQGEWIPVGILGIDDPIRVGVEGMIGRVENSRVRVGVYSQGNKGKGDRIKGKIGIHGLSVICMEDKGQMIEYVRGLKEKGEVVGVVGGDRDEGRIMECADIGIARGIDACEETIEISDILLSTGDITNIDKAITLSRSLSTSISTLTLHIHDSLYTISLVYILYTIIYPTAHPPLILLLLSTLLTLLDLPTPPSPPPLSPEDIYPILIIPSLPCVVIGIFIAGAGNIVRGYWGVKHCGDKKNR